MSLDLLLVMLQVGATVAAAVWVVASIKGSVTLLRMRVANLERRLLGHDFEESTLDELRSM